MKSKIRFFKVDSHTELDNSNRVPLEREFYNKPADWFEDREAAIAHYAEARAIAFVRRDEILRDLKALQARLGFQISYQMLGDTHGIYEDYQYISIRVNGYDFIVKTGDE